MVKTKSVKDPVEESDGERILVSRYAARGRSKESLSLTQHLPALGPTAKLLRDWKDKKISWEEYKSRYLEEISAQQEKIKDLARRARRGTITLLCFEQEDDPCCHRRLLKRLIEVEGSNSG